MPRQLLKIASNVTRHKTADAVVIRTLCISAMPGHAHRRRIVDKTSEISGFESRDES